MKTSSCKAKGREFQQKIRDMYRVIYRKMTGRQEIDGEIESRGMGQQGVDLIFTPRALEDFPHDIECKKHRSVGVPKHFEKHFEKYKNTSHLKLLFHENDRSEALVTMRAQDFIDLYFKMWEQSQDCDYNK